MLYKISTLNKIRFNGFQRPENAFPGLGAEVARSAARFKRLLGHHFLQAFLTPKRLYRICGGGRGGVTSQPLVAGSQELLRPAVVKTLCNAIAAAERGNALLPAQAFKHDADLVLGRYRISISMS